MKWLRDLFWKHDCSRQFHETVIFFFPQKAEQGRFSGNDTIQFISVHGSAALSGVPNKADLHTDRQ